MNYHDLLTLSAWGEVPVAADPIRNLQIVVNALLEYPNIEAPAQREGFLNVRDYLEAAANQMNFPEWAGNPDLERAYNLAKIAFERRMAGESFESVKNMMLGSRMSLRAASGKKSGPPPPEMSLRERMERLMIPPEEYYGIEVKEGGWAHGVVQSLREMAEGVFNFMDSPLDEPAGKRMAEIENLVRQAGRLSSEGDLLSAGKSLFKASILAKIAKESPVSPKEEAQADYVIKEVIPERTEVVRENFKNFLNLERQRRVQAEISPVESGGEEGWLAGGGAEIKLTGRTTPFEVWDPKTLSENLRRDLDIKPREYAKLVNQYMAYKPAQEIETIIGAGLDLYAHPKINFKKAIAAELVTRMRALGTSIKAITEARASGTPEKISNLVTELRALGTNGGDVLNMIGLSHRFGFKGLERAGMQIFHGYVVWTEQLDGFLRGIIR